MFPYSIWSSDEEVIVQFNLERNEGMKCDIQFYNVGYLLSVLSLDHFT